MTKRAEEQVRALLRIHDRIEQGRPERLGGSEAMDLLDAVELIREDQDAITRHRTIIEWLLNLLYASDEGIGEAALRSSEAMLRRKLTLDEAVRELSTHMQSVPRAVPSVARSMSDPLHCPRCGLPGCICPVPDLFEDDGD